MPIVAAQSHEERVQAAENQVPNEAIQQRLNNWLGDTARMIPACVLHNSAS